MNRVKALRIEAGMKQLELAKALTTTQQTISKYESETLKLDPGTIAQLCQIFDVTADYLLCMSDRRRPGISEDDAALVSAYHAAPQEIRDIVDQALDRYRQKKEAAAG